MNARAAWFLVVACTCAGSAAAAPLTEAEKKLLTSTVTESTAEGFGTAMDAASLERLIAIGDPALVRSFKRGLNRVAENKLPAGIEALVVKHYDDARVGEELRTIEPYYQTRALFDRHYARAKAAYKSDDPVFKQILRTNQAGVDEELLAMATRFPASQGQLSPAVMFAARRKHPGAVAPLIAGLQTLLAGTSSQSLSPLLAYNDPEVWKRTGAELERLKGAGLVTQKAYDDARKQLDPMLADPAQTIARAKVIEASNAYHTRKSALRPGELDLNDLRGDPRRYLEAMTLYLAKLDAIAAELNEEGVEYSVAGEYAKAGLYARFTARDPAQAVRFLEKAAKGRSLTGQVALADLYQVELRDKANAIRTYQLALDTANETGKRITPYASPKYAMHDFWKAWFAAELAFLRDGTPFRGAIAEPAIRGFWDAQGVWWSYFSEYFPEWPLPPGVVQSDWPSHAGRLAGMEPKGLGARLAPLPASRITLLEALNHVSALPDAVGILRELARHDPSGFWTTVALGSVAYYESSGRDAALANGLAFAMPGMAAAGKPNALATAARRHMQASTLRVVENK